MTDKNFLYQKQTQKQTENEPFEKGKFTGFAMEQKNKELKKKIKEILKENPEIYFLIDENESLKKEVQELLEENITLGEAIEKYKKNESVGTDLQKSIYTLQNQINEISTKYNTLKGKYNSLLSVSEKTKEENKQLKTNRSFFQTLADVNHLNLVEKENKELKEKLHNVGRTSITNDKIMQIIQLHNKKLGYDKISQKLNISKSTVHKYVHRYLDKKITINERGELQVN